MEPIPTSDAQNHRRSHCNLLPQHHVSAMKKSSRNSESFTVFGSLTYHSPHQYEPGEPPKPTPYTSPAKTFDKSPTANTKTRVAVEKNAEYSPLPSCLPEAHKPLVATDANRSVKEEDSPPAVVAAKAGRRGGREEGRSKTLSTILRRSRSREMVKRAGLGFRMSEMILCLISISVMAADKTQKWSGD